MAECHECGENEPFPYECNRCGETFCGTHRLPESHDCPGLTGDSTVVSVDGDDDGAGIVGRIRSTLPSFGGSRAGPLAGLENNVAWLFLGLMWLTFAAQIAAEQVLGEAALTTIFVLRSNHIEYVWTWFTSIFAHGGIMHILFNSLVLYFFGPVVEYRIGSRRFAVLFVVAGAVAGLAQVTTASFIAPAAALPTGVVGASGAIMAVMGVLTVLNPSLRVYLWFVIPMPLWVLTTGFAAYTVFVGVSGGIGAGGVAQLAHLAGLVIGLAYGFHVDIEPPSSLRLGGGGMGGPGGGPGRRL